MTNPKTEVVSEEEIALYDAIERAITNIHAALAEIDLEATSHEVQPIFSYVFDPELFGRLTVERAEVGDRVSVDFLGIRRHVAEGHVVDQRCLSGDICLVIGGSCRWHCTRSADDGSRRVAEQILPDRRTGDHLARKPTIAR